MFSIDFALDCSDIFLRFFVVAFVQATRARSRARIRARINLFYRKSYDLAKKQVRLKFASSHRNE